MVNNVINLDEKRVWELLNTIPDPDIPVISIVELGLVRKVEVVPGNKLVITLTPSYSGCPAMHVFKSEILAILMDNGANGVEIKTVLSPAWTTDWLSDATKNKLKQYGIAPPVKDSIAGGTLFAKKQVACPYCNSSNTKLTSEFGSTPCKALWYCNSCQQAFEYFKCH